MAPPYANLVLLLEIALLRGLTDREVKIVNELSFIAEQIRRTAS